jgi:hypothetical protein
MESNEGSCDIVEMTSSIASVCSLQVRSILQLDWFKVLRYDGWRFDLFTIKVIYLSISCYADPLLLAGFQSAS